MVAATHPHRLCPRCYASLASDATGCSRCGATLSASAAAPSPDDWAASARASAQAAVPAPEVAPYCPRCDRLERPGGRFTGALAGGPAGACPHCGTALVTVPPDAGLAYEEVSLAADSWDLDRLVRAEAVDGWTLVDTTIDPRSPQRLLAHFRRALPEGDPRARQLRGAAEAGRQVALPAAQGQPVRSSWSSAASAEPDVPARAGAPSAPSRPAMPSSPSASSAPHAPAAPPPPDARAARAAAKEARRAAKEAQRAARWERRRVHWEERLEQALQGARQGDPAKVWGHSRWKRHHRHPAAMVAMLVATVVGIGLFVSLQVLRHVALPLLFGLAMAFRHAFLSLFWGITGPQRQGARRR